MSDNAEFGKLHAGDHQRDAAPKISVIVVNYNGGDRLARCLGCLSEQNVADFETIVIDNGSNDDSIDLARDAAGKNTRFIIAGGNLGFAAGNNRAVKEARGKWLAFLNPDAYATPGWISAFLTGVQNYPDAEAFGSTQLCAADPDIVDGAGDCFSAWGIYYRGGYGSTASDRPGDGECFAPCAAAAFYRRETFEELGGFDERFFCYGEDVDLGFRLRLAGGRCIQLADAIVQHEGSGVTGRRSEFTMYHGHRNRLFVAYKNLPALLFWPFLPAFAAVNLLLLARFIRLGEAGPYLRAMRDGVLGLSAFRADRKRIQRNKKVGVGDIARMLTWSPLDVHRRAIDLKPIAPLNSLVDAENS